MQLLEDYKRRLSNINEMIADFNSDGGQYDEAKRVRLNTKAAMYREFIAELERFKSDSNAVKEVYRDAGYFGLHWSIRDIISAGKEYDVELSEEDAHEIADDLEKYADTEYGLTYQHIYEAVRDFKNASV